MHGTNCTSVKHLNAADGTNAAAAAQGALRLAQQVSLILASNKLSLKYRMVLDWH